MRSPFLRNLDEAKNCPDALRRFLDGESYLSQASRPDAEVVSTRQGRITTRVRGSHVHITVPLARGGRMLTLGIAGLILALATVVALNIYTAFATGRVRQILDHNAGANCAAIGDPVAAADCLYMQKKTEAGEPIDIPAAPEDQQPQPDDQNKPVEQ
jgi:hypothetical protein